MTEVLLILGLIILNGFFSMAEIALVSARKARLEAQAAKGDMEAKRALDLANHPQYRRRGGQRAAGLPERGAGAQAVGVQGTHTHPVSRCIAASDDRHPSGHRRGLAGDSRRRDAHRRHWPGLLGVG